MKNGVNFAPHWQKLASLSTAVFQSLSLTLFSPNRKEIEKTQLINESLI